MYFAESSLAKNFPELILAFNVGHPFEALEIVLVQGVPAGTWARAVSWLLMRCGRLGGAGRLV